MWGNFKAGLVFVGLGIASYVLENLLDWFKPMFLSTVSGFTIIDAITWGLIAVGVGLVSVGLYKQRKKKGFAVIQEQIEISQPKPLQESNDEPVLEIVEITNFDQWIAVGHLWENYALENYCLRIKKVEGKGAAEDCRANLVVQGTSIGNVPAIWRHMDQSTTVDISTIQDLRLFTRVRLHDKIFFPLADPNASGMTPEGENEQTFSKFVDKELEVWFGSKTGRFSQNPYRKKIADIIKESKSERPD